MSNGVRKEFEIKTDLELYRQVVYHSNVMAMDEIVVRHFNEVYLTSANCAASYMSGEACLLVVDEITKDLFDQIWKVGIAIPTDIEIRMGLKKLAIYMTIDYFSTHVKNSTPSLPGDMK